MKKLKIVGTNKEFEPRQIFCLGRNYAEHAKEMNSNIPTTPIVFMKPTSSIITDGEAIILPRISKDIHHEVELVVAIGKTGKNITANHAFDYIAGYALGLDMTLRDVQSDAKKQGLPWTVAKGFDTSAPISDIIPAMNIPNPQTLKINCRVNGILRQEGSTANMIFPIEKIIEYLSSIFTLEAGDLIFTGTPEGVGSVKAGDRIEAELVRYIKISHPVIGA